MSFKEEGQFEWGEVTFEQNYRRNGCCKVQSLDSELQQVPNNVGSEAALFRRELVTCTLLDV